ncbi:MAG: hypothetical protein KDK34_04975 [Leptospiraceae bacterium]|nr:hypothetical protein [Leptospiraceae bacterium]
MQPGGWLIMLLSVGGVTLFFGWSLFLVLTRKSADREHMHSTLDEPPDLNTD